MPRKNKPFFSIIVPAYNVEEYISQCADSVLDQEMQDFELIIIDDGSTDNTGEICDQIAKKWPHLSIVSQNSEKVNTDNAKTPVIKVIHQENQGLSGARNTGIVAANGEYLILLDGDDYLEEDALRKIQQGIEPGLDILRYQAQEVFDDGRTVEYGESGFAILPGVQAFQELRNYHYTENAWLYAYRREFFVGNNFRYADGRLAEDFGLTPLVIAKAQSVKAISDICYNYRQRTGSIMHDSAKLAKRVDDMLAQLETELPALAKIPGASSIAHYLVVSFLTSATNLNESDFQTIYQKAKQQGILKYIHPTNPKSAPRAELLKHFPKLFYRIYGQR